MNSETALVSVIIATYKRNEELGKALESLVNQSYSNIEVVLVDDNADEMWNDIVQSVVNEYMEKLNLHYIVNKTNHGSAETRNIGIRAAKGDYITFLDDDDEYLPEKVSAQIDDILKMQADFGITDLFLYNEKNLLIDRRIRSYIEKQDTNSLMRYHIMNHMTGTDTMMFRADYLRSIGGFPGIDIGDEFYLMKEAILNGGKFCYSNHCYVKAYVHSGENNGLSSGRKKIDGENALFQEKKKYYSYLNKKDIRFVEMRHYAVIAFAELRRKAYVSFMKNAFMSFFSSPTGCIKLLLGKSV